MKLQQTQDSQMFLNLPRAILRAKNWRKSDIIDIIITKEGDLLLKKRVE